MKKFILMFILSSFTAFAYAEVITLNCEGAKQNGEPFKIVLTFSPDHGWVKSDSSYDTMRGAVTAEYINAFIYGMTINRKTGEFTQGPSDNLVKGMCVKNDTKF